MFLQHTERHNKLLIDYALELISSKHIEPDTYVIDLDGIEANSMALLNSATKNNIKLYCMLKQLGRNPKIAQTILNCSTKNNATFEGIVAVDFREALHLHNAGLPIKNVGHLVQIPECHIASIVQMKPEVITVYSYEKIKQIALAMKETGLLKQGYTQNILLRVTGANDLLYPSQEAGFSPKEIPQIIEQIQSTQGLEFAGLTSFPCFLYNSENKKINETQNAHTLIETATMLQEKYGIECKHINMPSCNTVESIEMIAKMGGSHAEPGHSLTGTSPDTIDCENPLIPSIVYASEISHNYKQSSFCYGGGHYRRSGIKNAVVETPEGRKYANVHNVNAEAIDYHFELEGQFKVGSPVVMAFRTQIFVTRSRVALIKGIQKGSPKLDSIWDSQGNHLSDCNKKGCSK